MTLKAYREALIAIDNNQIDYFSNAFTKEDINVNGPDGGWTVLMYAVMVDNAEIVTLLLFELGADPNILNDHSDTALIIGARHGAIASISLLLKKGADHHARNRDERNALIQAIHYEQMDCLNLLLPLYLTPDFLLDEHDSKSLAPLNHAVTYGNTEAVRLLLENGADVSTMDDSGYSLLHHAVLEGYPKIAELLLAVKDDWISELPDGRNIREVASTKRMRKLLNRFLAHE